MCTACKHRQQPVIAACFLSEKVSNLLSEGCISNGEFNDPLLTISLWKRWCISSPQLPFRSPRTYLSKSKHSWNTERCWNESPVIDLITSMKRHDISVDHHPCSLLGSVTAVIATSFGVWQMVQKSLFCLCELFLATFLLNLGFTIFWLGSKCPLFFLGLHTSHPSFCLDSAQDFPCEYWQSCFHSCFWSHVFQADFLPPPDFHAIANYARFLLFDFFSITS